MEKKAKVHNYLKSEGVKELNYLEVLLTIDGKVERETDRRFGAGSVVVQRELS